MTSSPKQTSTRPAHASLGPRPSFAEQAFMALEHEIEAYTGGPVNHALVDLRVASAVARNVALRDQEPARRASFDRLAKVGLYDGALPARIIHLALATWFNHQRQVGRMALASTAIFDGLGIVRDGDAKRWATLCQRTWTLLLADYEEHRSAGVFLFHKLEDVAETYPPLVSTARR